MSHMPVSAVSISEGVVIGVLRILFRVLSMIFCIWFSSFWVGVQVSAPYVIIGIMQEWYSLHIVAISMLWNSSFDASVSIVWRATSVFPLSFFIWSSKFPLLFMVIPRYLYMSVWSMVWSPIFRQGVTSLFFMISIWLFSLPNLMWNLFAISSVVLSIFWTSFLSWCARATSSIHSRHPGTVLLHSLWFPICSLVNSFAISSIRLAYPITDSTPMYMYMYNMNQFEINHSFIHSFILVCYICLTPSDNNILNREHLDPLHHYFCTDSM